MKKLHNLVLASILCIGTQAALANTDTTSSEGISSTTIEQLVSQIQSLSLEDRKALRKAVRAQLEGDRRSCQKSKKDGTGVSREKHEEHKVSTEKDSDKRDAKKKCHNKKGMKGWMHEMGGEPGMDKGKMKHRQEAGMEKKKFEKWIGFLFNKYHSQQHHSHQ
ncbi:MAG: hypothetical protein AAEF23_06235 [Gammaproteobacteria bacterium]